MCYEEISDAAARRLRGARVGLRGDDSVLCGFAGVLVELCRKDDRYVLSETAAGSGDRLLEFSSKDERLVRGTFEKELSALSA